MAHLVLHLAVLALLPDHQVDVVDALRVALAKLAHQAPFAECELTGQQ
jgi:hypothetical protein